MSPYWAFVFADSENWHG